MTTIRSTLSCLTLCGLLLADGCTPFLRANASPPAPAEGRLSATLQQAEREALALRFGVADRLLAEFAEQHPGAPESVEVGFWRALFKLDPANQTGGPRDAIALFDAYLAAPQTVAHRGAATSLRRVALVLDRPPTVVAASAAPGPVAPTAKAEPKPDQSNADEVQRLKEELAKANAELERIKRRVAPPNP
jgi:hypothetical protein